MNLVFDFGGVLFRWQPHEFIARLLPERAPNEAAAHATVLEFFEGFGGDWGEFDRGTIDAGPLAERIAARTGLSLAQTRSVIDAVPEELRPVPGTVDLLRRLHQAGWPLYYLSNMPEPYARHLEATHDFVAWFRSGLFSSRVRLIKPEPAIFTLAASSFGVEPGQTLFIDDVAHNVDAARAAGWQALRFHNPQQCEEELVRRGLL